MRSYDKIPTFGIWDKVTVVATVTQTVDLRSPDRSRHPPDRKITMSRGPRKSGDDSKTRDDSSAARIAASNPTPQLYEIRTDIGHSRTAKLRTARLKTAMQSSLVDARNCTSAFSRLPRPCRSQQVVRCEQTQHTKHSINRSGDGQQFLQLCAGALAVQQISCTGAAQASEAVGGISEATSTLPLALGGGAAIAALSAALLATDPQKRSVAMLAHLHPCRWW